MKQNLIAKNLLSLVLGLNIGLSAQAQTLSDALDNGEPLSLGVGVSGQIAEVFVAPGEAVHKGQALLTLNTEHYQSTVNATGAHLDYLKFKAQLAEEDYARHQELFEEGSFSTVELQVLELGVKQANSELAMARAAHQTAKQDLVSAQIIAPVDGRILAVPLAGQQVSIEGGIPVLIKMRLP